MSSSNVVGRKSRRESVLVRRVRMIHTVVLTIVI